jgi:hypothetical protein
LPGVEEVFASFWLSLSILINDDFPTLLRPMKANSGLSGGGHILTSGLLITYVAVLITIGARYSNLPAVLTGFEVQKGCRVDRVKHLSCIFAAHVEI